MLPKSFLSITLFFLFFSGFLLGQRSTPTELRLDNLYGGEAVQVYDFRPRELEGSLYYSEEAMPGAIKLHNGKKLTAEKILFNLESNALEIITDRGVFAVPGGAVEEFTLQGESALIRYISPTVLTGGKGLEKIDFVRYELEGDPSLLSGYEIEILRPNYVPALDAGSRNPKAIQKERFFLLADQELSLLPTRRKKAAEMLELYRPGVDTFLKKEGIDLKARADLIRLFQWLNEE